MSGVRKPRHFATFVDGVKGLYLRRAGLGRDIGGLPEGFVLEIDVATATVQMGFTLCFARAELAQAPKQAENNEGEHVCSTRTRKLLHKFAFPYIRHAFLVYTVSL